MKSSTKLWEVDKEFEWDKWREKIPFIPFKENWLVKPTPQASDNRDRGNLSSGSVQRRKEKGKQISLSQSVSEESGNLNPQWVEWLMGFPIGWTDLNHSEMP